MLEQVADEFAPVLSEREMRCELRLPERMPYACDPDKLARVFDNLLRNACNYGDPGTAVEIDGRPDESGVELTFSNSGRTIPPEKLERLFDRAAPARAAQGWVWPSRARSPRRTAARSRPRAPTTAWCSASTCPRTARRPDRAARRRKDNPPPNVNQYRHSPLDRFVLRACNAELFRVRLPSHGALSGQGCVPEEG